MAKLTARFDMQDRITKKLRGVRSEAERLERSRAKLNKPLVLTVRDKAMRPLRAIGRYISRDLAKVHRIGMAVRDRASGPVNAIGNLIRARFPRTHQMLLRAQDRASPMLRRISTYMKGNILGARWMWINARDGATPTIRRIATYARMALGKGYSFTIRAVDRVTRTAGRMGAHINRAIPRVVNSTIRVTDMATRPLRHIARMATSTLGLLGVAGGVGGGIIIPLKMVAEREDLTTAFEVMLGSADAANKRMADLTDFAGRTPLTRDEIFRSSRVLQTFTGDALSTAKGMQIIGDVAVGTQTPLEETATWFGRLYDGLESGRPIGMATNRLQEMGAISGEARQRIEDLAESGKNIKDIWPAVTKEFEQYNGMMEKMSDNTNNLLLGLKSFVQNFILMPWGEGLRDAFKPALIDFRAWRGEYGFVLRDMSASLKTWGGQFAEGLLRPTSGILKTIGDQMKILFPGGLTEELELQMKEDPALRKRFEELEQYRDMSFQVRWELVKTNIGDGISEWWESKGRDQAARVGKNIGATYGGFIHSAIVGILGGTAEETGNPFIDTGITAGTNFISGFIEALDPAKLATAIASAVLEANKSAMRSIWGKLTGNKELEESGSIMGAVIGNALVLMVMAKIGGMLKNLKPLIDGAMRAGGWLLGRGRGGRIPPMPIPPRPKAPPQPRTPRQTRTDRGKPVYRQPWFGKGDPHTPNVPNQKPPKVPGGFSKALKGLGNFAKRIPILGTVLGGLSIATADNKAAATGGVAGGFAGAMAGGALGTAVPIIGNVIGAIIGGIVGAIGGEKIVTWVQDNWDKIKTGAADAAAWVGDKWNTAWDWVKGVGSDIGGWFTTSIWEPIKDGAADAGEWIGDKFTDAKDWVSDKWSSFSGWFSTNVWTPFSDAAINTMNFFVGLWDVGREWISEKWGDLSDWFTESVWEPVKEGAAIAGQWISDKYTDAKEWVSETWETVSEWFDESVWTPIKTGAAIAGQWISDRYTDAKEWISETWATVSEWFDESVWTPVKEGAAIAGQWISDKYTAAKDWVAEKWAPVADWFTESVWEPVKEGAAVAGQWISDKYDEAKTWISDTWGVFSSWFDDTVWTPIKDGAKDAKDWIGEKFDEGVQWAKDAWDGLSGWFDTNVWDPVKTGAGKAWDWVKGKWNDAKDWASDITKRGEEITGVTTSKGGSSGNHSAIRSAPTQKAIPGNATGGYITKPMISWIGEAGNEYVIPTENNIGRGRMLLHQAASDLGMQVSDRDHAPQIQAATTFTGNSTLDNESLQVLNGLAAQRASKGGNDMHVEVVFSGDNHYQDDFDAEKHGHVVVKVIKDYLSDELDTGGEGLYDI